MFYTISMFVMSVLGYNNMFLFDIFGLAIICLSCGDAAANIIGSTFGKVRIYQKKSLEGTVACLIISCLGMFLLRQIFDIDIRLEAIVILSILCAITELYSGAYDNISIPLVLYVAAYIMLKNGLNGHFWTSFGIGLAMWIFAVVLKLLNGSAAYMLFVMILFLVYFGGTKSFAAIMLIFSIIILVEKLLEKKTNAIFASTNKEHGERNERQLLANCLLPVVAICIFGITQNKIFIVAYFAALAETVGDSIASDIGVLSKNDPIDITSFKRVQRGISGGVSIIGTVASFIICAFSAMVAMWLYKCDLRMIFAIGISSFLGILLDSILGSKVQVKFKCNVCGKITEKESHCGEKTHYQKGVAFLDNTRINMICNLFSLVVSCLIMAL